MARSFEEQKEFINGEAAFLKSMEKNTEIDIEDDKYSKAFKEGFKNEQREFNKQMGAAIEEDIEDSVEVDLTPLENDVEYTDNIHEAIWITPDNDLISGEYDMGTRGIDHNNLLDTLDLDRGDSKSWDKIHELGFIRLIPESETAMIYTNQPMTQEQKDIVEEIDFKYESYGIFNKDFSIEEEKTTDIEMEMER